MKITCWLSIIPQTRLKEKCNAMTYHAVGKSVAIGESLKGHIRSEDNPDLLTKMVNEQNRRYLVSLVLYDTIKGKNK